MRRNPIKRTFTPSYPAETKEEYERKVRTGPKRLEHVQIEGGRTRLRYGEESPAHDPPTYRAPERMAGSTKRRLAQQEPPWDARTQSPSANEEAHRPKSSAEEKIKQAIETYRKESPQGALGLLIPRDPRLLIRAGMPPKAANLLVDRAGGVLISALPAAPFSKPDLETLIARGLGRPLEARRGKLIVRIPGEQQPAEVTKIVVSAGSKQFVVRPQSIEQAYYKFKEQVEQKGKRYDEDDDRRFVGLTYKNLNSIVQALTSRDPTAKPDLTFHLVRRGQGSTVSISLGEHSKIPTKGAALFHVDYKSMENVDLAALPHVLARLARRKRRKERNLPLMETSLAKRNPDEGALKSLLQQTGEPVPVPGKPGRVYIYSKRRDAIVETTPKRARAWLAIGEAGRTARNELSQAARESFTAQENPMARRKYTDDDFFLSQYQQGPYGARAAVPVARRNSAQLVGPVLFTKNGQPYRRTADGKARFISRAQAGMAASNPHDGRAVVNRKKGKRKGSPHAAAAARRAQEIFRAQGCSMRDAMKQAWAEVKSGARAAANPWYYEEYAPLYLPDMTQTRGALVPGPYGRSNPERFDAQSPSGVWHKGGSGGMFPRWAQSQYDEQGAFDQGERATEVPDSWGDSPFWGGRQLQRGGFAARMGQFSASGTGGFQPMNRRNPRKGKKAKKR